MTASRDTTLPQAAERGWSWRRIGLGAAVGLALPPLLFASFLIAARVLASPAADEKIGAPLRASFAAGAVVTGFGDAAAESGVPGPVLAQVYRVLAHAVDLQRDINPGDSFRVGFETGGAAEKGRLLFLWLDMRDRTLAVYRHTTRDGFTGYFDDRGRGVERPLLRTPVEGARLSSVFGMRLHPILGYSRMHRGLDFAAPAGTPVLAAGDGAVAELGTKGGYGRYVRIDHGPSATAYGHLSAFADGLAVGERVRQGDVIGYVGSSGLATGPHLHYEVLVDDERVDPREAGGMSGQILAGPALEHYRTERIRMLVTLQRARQAGEADVQSAEAGP